MAARPGAAAAPSALPTLVALTTAYVLSQFFRTAMGVVAPEIARDLNLDPAGLGLLSSAWFWAFAAMQIPVGVALDRWGPRRTVSLLFTVAGAGCALLASADGLGVAILGQVLIGIGCAPVFMGTLMVLARFYDTGRFAYLSAIVLAIGNGGTLIGTTPLALLAQALGWRGSFLVMAALVVVVALLVGRTVRDRPEGSAADKAETLGAALRGVLDVVRNRHLWPLLPMAFTAYGVVVTLRGLWAGPYLAEVWGMSPVGRGNILFVMSLAMIASNVVYGSLERRLDRRRELVIAGTGVTVAAFVVLGLAPAASLLLASVLLAVIGFAGMTYAMMMAQGRRFMPEHQLGRSLTFLNGICFFGAALLQLVSGIVVDLGRAGDGGPEAAYGILFLFLSICLFAAILPYRRSIDRRL